MNETNAEKYIGQTRMMNCGMNATVIAYRGCNDIDVRFENGTIREHMRISSWKNGEISKISRDKSQYIGKTKTMNCGMKATIIAYRNANDMDVQFENGVIRKHRQMCNFQHGEISNMVLTNKEQWIGQTRTMKCGMKATIIEYRKNNDIDIQFENGVIREHTFLESFKKGTISNVIRPKGKDYFGQTRIMNCGLKATVIAYKRNYDIDVQFENGIIRKHMTLDSFLKGKILPTPNPIGNEHIGQTRTMNCGLKATIIAYRNPKDIDVQFEDGTVRKHIQLKSFHARGITNKTLGKSLYKNKTCTLLNGDRFKFCVNSKNRYKTS